jgi:hypothetical protein
MEKQHCYGALIGNAHIRHHGKALRSTMYIISALYLAQMLVNNIKMLPLEFPCF